MYKLIFFRHLFFCLVVFFSRTAGPKTTKFGTQTKSNLMVVLGVFSSTTSAFKDPKELQDLVFYMLESLESMLGS